MKMLDFFNSPEELDKFLVENRNKKDFRMVIKPFGLAVFYGGKLQQTKKRIVK